jgi:hypothetical protein
VLKSQVWEGSTPLCNIIPNVHGMYKYIHIYIYMRAHICEFLHGPDKDKTQSLGTRKRKGKTKSLFTFLSKAQCPVSCCLLHPLRHSLLRWGFAVWGQGILVRGRGIGGLGVGW